MTLGRLSAEPPDQLSIPASWLARLGPIIAACLALLGALARQTGVPRYRTIWAEDGQVFAQCAYSDLSPLPCVVTPYDAWLQLVSRLLAEIATLMPPSLLSYGLAGLAAIVAAGCGYLTARAVRDVTRSGVAGCVAGASLLLIAPAAREVGGNITNVHWIMFVAGVTVLVATWLDHRFDLADGVLVGLLAWSSPFGLVLLAFAVFGILLGRRQLVAVTAVVGAAVVVQLGLALTAQRIAVPNVAVGLLSPIDWYVRYVVQAGIFGDRGRVPDWLATVGIVAVIGGLLRRVILDRRAHAESVGRLGIPGSRPVLEIVAVAALIAAGLAVFAASTYLNRHVAPRYVYVPAALMMVALFTGAGLLARHASNGHRHWPAGWPEPGRVGVAALAVVVAIGFASSFRIRNGASAGPDFPAGIAAARGECVVGLSSLTFRISPIPTAAIPTIWQIEIPCDRLLP